jgi:hypothetical protein
MTVYEQRAREANDYVLRRMRGANWDQWSGEPSWENRDGPMDALDVCVYRELRGGRPPPRPNPFGGARENLSTVLEHGKKALLAGCGNCTEFTSAAFLYLYAHRVFPVDYMSMERSDHRFLLVGRHSGDPRVPESWNPGTIVCDPWMEGLLRSMLERAGEDPEQARAHGVYDARLLKERMLVEEERHRNPRTWGLIGRHRQDGRVWEHVLYYGGLP